MGEEETDMRFDELGIYVVQGIWAFVYGREDELVVRDQAPVQLTLQDRHIRSTKRTFRCTRIYTDGRQGRMYQDVVSAEEFK